MAKQRFYKILTYSIALVWLVNGLFCKVLDFVPRHEQIVASILSSHNSRLITLIIGFAEIGMSIWILTGFRSKLNAIAQIIIVMTMNIIEFLVVSDLLLWGKGNIVFAFGFVLVVYFKEFVLQNATWEHSV